MVPQPQGPRGREGTVGYSQYVLSIVYVQLCTCMYTCMPPPWSTEDTFGGRGGRWGLAPIWVYISFSWWPQVVSSYDQHFDFLTNLPAIRPTWLNVQSCEVLLSYCLRWNRIMHQCDQSTVFAMLDIFYSESETFKSWKRIYYITLADMRKRWFFLVSGHCKI